MLFDEVVKPKSERDLIGRSIDRIIGSSDMTSERDIKLILKRDISSKEMKALKENLKLKAEEQPRRRGIKEQKEKKSRNLIIERDIGIVSYFGNYCSLFIPLSDFEQLRDKEIKTKERLIMLFDLGEKQNAYLSKADIIKVLNTNEKVYDKVIKQVDKKVIDFHYSRKDSFPNGRYFTKGKGEIYKRLDSGNAKLLYQREHRFLREKIGL